MIKQYGLSRNLFDYSTMAPDTNTGYLNSSGEVQSNADWRYTDYIPCDGTNFVLSKIWGNAPAICFYAADKTFISGANYGTSGGSEIRDILATASSTAKFIRFSYYNSVDLSNIMLSEGTDVIPYEAYGTGFYPRLYEYIYGESKNLANVADWTNTNTDTKANFNLSITAYKGSTSLGERRLDVANCGFISLTTASGANGIDKLIIKHNGSTRDLAIATVENLDVPSNTPVTFSCQCNGNNPGKNGGIILKNIMLAEGSAALPFQTFGSTGWQPYFEHKKGASGWDSVERGLALSKNTVEIPDEREER